MSDPQPLTLTRLGNGGFAVKEWLPRTTISTYLLEVATSEIEAQVEIRAVNGVRRYKVVGVNRNGTELALELLP